jgi:hypothetical protein
MLWLIGLGAAAIALFAIGGSKDKANPANIKAWDILLQGPAAIPQTAIVELLTALGITEGVKGGFISSPQPGYNVLHVETTSAPPAVGKSVVVQGVPLRVMTVNLAPVG